MPLPLPWQVRRANAGRDPFPLFLKRGKVYKDIDSYLNIDAPTTHARWFGTWRLASAPALAAAAHLLITSPACLKAQPAPPPHPRAQLRPPTGPQEALGSPHRSPHRGALKMTPRPSA